MQIFNFNGATVRTVTLAGGEPGFVGKDVAERLGYANPNKAMGDHCKGVPIRYPLPTAGGMQHCRGVALHHPIPDALGRMQQTRVLTEADVMRLIVSG